LALPTFLTIGAHKCGTTALHEYLGRHPEIHMSRTKELHFFVDEVNWRRGTDWYESYFPSATTKVRGESSPSYTNYPTYAGVPERAFSVIPTAKLIFCVRDPIERIKSHFRMERARAPEPRPFSEVVMRNLDNPYVNQSRYWFQIKQWLNFYGFARVLVLSQEDLNRNRRQTLQRVFAFLGVDPLFDHPSFSVRHNTSGERERVRFGERPPAVGLEADEVQRLQDVIAPDLAEFRRFMGLEFPDWQM
jgi:hypothetical protein